MDVDIISAVGQALADPTRLKVLRLADGRLGIGEIAARLNVTSATASHHVAVLAAVGFVTVERRGRQTLPRRLPDAGLRLARALG